MALAAFLSRSAERDALIESDIFAELRGLADDNACTMIDEQPLANRRAGMNFNPGQKAPDIRYDARNEHPTTPIKCMRDAMQPDRMKSRVAKENFDNALCRRVTFKNDADILAKPGKEFHSILAFAFSGFTSFRYRRRRKPRCLLPFR